MNLTSFQKIGKTVGLVLLLLSTLVATIFLGKTASQYLAKAESCPTEKVQAVQITANTAVISWQSEKPTLGKVEYGTEPGNLTFAKIEEKEGTTHNVLLDLLTPETKYYYLIKIGEKYCGDKSGQTCTHCGARAGKNCQETCYPWSFTTSAIVPQEELVATLPPATPTAFSPSPSPIFSPSAVLTKTVSPTVISSTTSAKIATSGEKASSPSGTLSAFCQELQFYLGESSKDATKWATLKKYDLDNNNILNSRDVLLCQTRGL